MKSAKFNQKRNVKLPKKIKKRNVKLSKRNADKRQKTPFSSNMTPNTKLQNQRELSKVKLTLTILKS